MAVTEKMISIPLNKMQKRFVREYMMDGKVKASAIRAGYSPKSASWIGSKLLRDPRVVKELAGWRKETEMDTGISPQRILKELALIGFFNIKDVFTMDDEGNYYIDINSLDHDKTAAICELQIDPSSGKLTSKRVKIKVADKISALVQMGKHLGMFKEKIEHSGTLSLEQLVMNSMEDRAPVPVASQPISSLPIPEEEVLEDAQEEVEVSE